MRLAPPSKLATLGILLVAVLLVYAWANRTGRYQVARVAYWTAGFVVLGTATGAHWIHEAKQGTDGSVLFRPVDAANPVPFKSRLLPPCPLCE
jgi:hypothetical protein